MSEELYKAFRPLAYSEVYGQESAVAVLKGFLANGQVPHTLLFTGHTGAGKTTMARITASKLGCPPTNDKGQPTHGYTEVNAAISRGIDTIREIEMEYGKSTFTGGPRVYVIDECHQLMNTAQSALLKMLEDTPKHVYFMLCTTDPGKLLPTIKGRCTEIKISPLSQSKLKEILLYVLSLSGKTTPAKEVLTKIVDAANGSARNALVLLNKVVLLPSMAEQLDAITKEDSNRQAFDLVKKLLWEGSKWPEVAELLKELKEADLEPLRRALLSCAAAEMLKGDKKAGWANLIIEEFEKPLFDSGWPGLCSKCYSVLRVRDKR